MNILMTTPTFRFRSGKSSGGRLGNKILCAVIPLFCVTLFFQSDEEEEDDPEEHEELDQNPLEVAMDEDLIFLQIS